MTSRSILPFFALPCAFVVFATSACAAVPHADKPMPNAFEAAPKARLSRDELINVGGWKLDTATTTDGGAIEALSAAGMSYELKFDADGTATANGGCNTLRGEYRATSNRVELDLSIATRMACEDAKNQADARMSELLKGTFKAELRETQPMRLRLIAPGGEVLILSALPLSL